MKVKEKIEVKKIKAVNQKILIGKIVSLKMEKTAIVEVYRDYIHPMYKKIIKKSRKHKADTNNLTLNLGDMVKIVETRPMGQSKHFKVLEVTK